MRMTHLMAPEPTQLTLAAVSPVASPPAWPATCPSAAVVPATVCSPPQALGPVGVVCGRACECLRPCLCINKPILGVQALMVSCSGFGLPLHAQLLRLFVKYSLFRPRAPALQCLDVFWAPGSCPGASSLVVCALGWYLLRPRWVPCWSALAALVAGDVV